MQRRTCDGQFPGLRFDDRSPVYQQVAEYLKRQILLGLVEDGEPMPSRRELAAQTGINPNTAQKAYRLMTEEGCCTPKATPAAPSA